MSLINRELLKSRERKTQKPDRKMDKIYRQTIDKKIIKRWLINIWKYVQPHLHIKKEKNYTEYFSPVRREKIQKLDNIFNWLGYEEMDILIHYCWE